MPGSEHHDEQMCEAKYRLIREAEHRVMLKLTAFADKEGLWPENPEELVELFGEHCRPLVETEAFLDEFLPSWWLFQPFPAENESGEWQSYADDFFAARESRMREDDKAFVRAVREAPYGVYYVEDVEPGESLSVRSIATDARCEVTERTASKTLQRGTIVYTRVAQMYGLHFFFGMAPAVLPPDYYTEIEDIAREKEEVLVEKFKHVTNFPPRLLRGEVVRRAFFLMIGETFGETLPELLDAAGNPLVGVTLQYELSCPAEETYRALLPLSQGLAQGDDGRDRDDPELFVMPCGSATGGSQLSALISIKGASLTLEAYSASEADELAGRIEEMLGDRAVLKERQEKPMQEALHAMVESGSLVQIAGKHGDQEQMMQSPEVREKLKQMADEHWERWYETAIPALNGETPLEAAKTQEGRNRLEALFAIYEANAAKVTEDFLRPDIDAFRRRLGMERGDWQ